MLSNRLTSLRPQALSLLRIVTAFTYSLHGYQKLFGAFGGLGKGFKPELLSLLGMAGVIEVFGGFMLLLGLFTRPVALLLSGQMAVAYFSQHAPRGFWPIKNGGELAVVYCFLFLYFSTAGGGSWSLDRWLRGIK